MGTSVLVLTVRTCRLPLEHLCSPELPDISRVHSSDLQVDACLQCILTFSFFMIRKCCVLDIFLCHRRRGLRREKWPVSSFLLTTYPGQHFCSGGSEAQRTDADKTLHLCVTRKEKQVRAGQSSRHFCKRLNAVFSFFHLLSC